MSTSKIGASKKELARRIHFLQKQGAFISARLKLIHKNFVHEFVGDGEHCEKCEFRREDVLHPEEKKDD